MLQRDTGQRCDWRPNWRGRLWRPRRTGRVHELCRVHLKDKSIELHIPWDTVCFKGQCLTKSHTRIEHRRISMTALFQLHAFHGETPNCLAVWLSGLVTHPANPRMRGSVRPASCSDITNTLVGISGETELDGGNRPIYFVYSGAICPVVVLIRSWYVTPHSSPTRGCW